MVPALAHTSRATGRARARAGAGAGAGAGSSHVGQPQLHTAYLGYSALPQLHIHFIPLFFQLKPANGVILSELLRGATSPANTWKSQNTVLFPNSQGPNDSGAIRVALNQEVGPAASSQVPGVEVASGHFSPLLSLLGIDLGTSISSKQNPGTKEKVCFSR